MLAPLAARDLHKAFAGVGVLHGVSLELRQGEIVALLGENGAGKSTLLNILSGVLRPDAGAVLLDGAARAWRGPREARDAGVAVVHQELSVVRGMSVAENIFLGDYCARRGWTRPREMMARTRPLLDRVGAGHVSPRARMGDLGIADQQLVEIAKSLARDVRVLILDEPTSSLTPHEAAALFAVMRTLRDAGVALAFISHRLDEVVAVGDRVLVLRDGRLVRDMPAGVLDRARVIADMTGRAVAVPARPLPPTSGPIVVRARGLGDGRGVGPIDLDVRAGEILGVFGLVGAGRTTLLRMLGGSHQALTGDVVLHDGGGAPRTAREAWRRGVASLPEDRKSSGIAPSLTVRENMLLSLRRRRAAWLSASGEHAVTAPLLGQLAVRGAPDQPTRQLSGGNQQKAILARCLAVAPRLLLLDEPTRGIDVGTKAQLYAVIQALARDGVAVVFVSSELPEILALASTVLVLAQGRPTLYAVNAGLNEETVLGAAFAEPSPAPASPDPSNPVTAEDCAARVPR